jgi:hypothetical protein
VTTFLAEGGGEFVEETSSSSDDEVLALLSNLNKPV